MSAERRFDAGPGSVVQIRGEAKDARSGRELSFSQTIIFHGDRYLRVLAITPRGRAEALDRADRLATSIVMK